MEPTLTEIVKLANQKRKTLGIKISESNYLPQFKSTKNITLVDGSPYIVEVMDGETAIRPYFTNKEAQ